MPVHDGYFEVCDAGDLLPGEVGEFLVDGVPIALANVEGQFHAVDNICPHAGGPLGDGTVENGSVICPLHGWSFDLSNGVCELDPDLVLTRHPTERRGDAVWVGRAPMEV